MFCMCINTYKACLAIKAGSFWGRYSLAVYCLLFKIPKSPQRPLVFTPLFTNFKVSACVRHPVKFLFSRSEPWADDALRKQQGID